MTHDPIFRNLPTAQLPQLAKTLTFDPLTGNTPTRLLSTLSEQEQSLWLDTHRVDLEDYFSFVGSSFLAYVTGNGKSYRQIVMDMADKLSASYHLYDETTEIEQSVVCKMWNDTVARMTPEQRQELLAQAEVLATKYGVGFGKEIAGFATLTVAQMSGFGVYLLGSTLLGAINGALGLGLGFGVFTGLSSLISTVIGPAGWAALGLFTILKLGQPNYKKLLPAIIIIATARAAQSGPQPPTSKVKTGLPARTSPVLSSTPVTEQTASSSLTTIGVQVLQLDVARASDQVRIRSRRSVKLLPTSVRKCSKQEKIIFDQKQRTLAAFTRNLVSDVHYLDLESRDRELVDELYRQYLANQIDEAQEKERNERLLAEHRKRENRLRNKGKNMQLDSERKRNFDNEFAELANFAAEYDQTRHYLDMDPGDQQFIKEYAASERKEKIGQRSMQGQRLSELEQAYARASAKQQPKPPAIFALVGGGKNGAVETNGSTHHVQIVNLEAGYPTAGEARKRLNDKIKSVDKAAVTVLKLIHGYGSTGNGGAIRYAARHSLRRRRTEGSIRAVVHGENWSIFSEDSRQLLEECPELKADHDIERSNPGITFVLL